ncbi:STY4851/ECs_5259 family protein [Thiohalocapsa sp. ML1]|jgi:hypothetical protein|uniref:STY4851/ECs_5259 family protein n=1 Tax=Thiohalocapsa sp. ML1 TaxID=1431688 RepID=UPI000731EF68|nr:STY4851/ECs_5259 family protein [Thiohalocapsa sp. ML1]
MPLAQFLFTHTRQTQPDGRPLYAYRATDHAFDDLRAVVIERLRTSRSAIELPAAFCLFAAETFRREHAGGPWTWETIFQPLGLPAPPQPQIGVWVEQGLKFWQRPLLIGGGGQRLFLVTIACEGGLPLRLLAQQDAHLTRFFRAVLEGYFRAGQGGSDVALAQARQHVARLPASLRQEPVLQLAGQLVVRVAELQGLVGAVPDPIAALDQCNPQWRRTLPLRLDDQVAQRLLTGLIRHSEELARQARGQPRWCGVLRPTAEGWCLQRRLEFPEYATPDQIAAWAMREPPTAARLRLLLAGMHGMEAIAWLTRVEESASPARYRLEWLRRGGVATAGDALMETSRLMLSDDETESVLPAIDEDPWGPLPWVFIQRGRSGQWQWLAEGQVRTRDPQVLVLVPPGMAPCGTADDGVFESKGRLALPDRLVYVVSGTAAFADPEQQRWHIRCGQQTDSAGSYVLSGRRLALAGTIKPLHLGLPAFQVLDDLGGRTEAPGSVQWRPVGDGGAWRPRTEPGHGLLWLRLLGVDGVECCRRQIHVLPRQFQVSPVIGSAGQPGVLRLTSLAGADVSVRAEVNGEPLVAVRGADSAEIRCPVTTGRTPEPVPITLAWPDAEPLVLTLPYPQRGAFFALAGRVLPPDDCIALDRLAGLQVVVQDAASGAAHWLRIELVGGDAALPPFQQRLPALEQGRLDCALYRWQARIASLLASAGALEDQVRLIVETGSGQRLAQVRVARFDAWIEPDRNRGVVGLPEGVVARLDAGWRERVRVGMIPLWEPTAVPIELAHCANGEPSWAIPDGLESGPWWVLAKDGDWSRFRPLLWSVAPAPPADAAEETAPSALTAAIREPDPQVRAAAIGHALALLAADPAHPDWDLLSGFVALTRTLPATSLDAICALTRRPAALARLLLRSDEQGFAAVWALSEQLPFLWMLLPVADWRAAAAGYFQWLRQSLAGIECADAVAFGQFEHFRDRVAARRPYWRALCDWLQEQVFAERPLPASSELRRARADTRWVDELIEGEEAALQGRHDADARWPDGPEVMAQMMAVTGWMRGYRYAHLAGFYRPVRQAPFAAAHIALSGSEPAARLSHELRLLRAFDREWFDRVHAIALTIGLAELPPVDHAPGS